MDENLEKNFKMYNSDEDDTRMWSKSVFKISA